MTHHGITNGRLTVELLVDTICYLHSSDTPGSPSIMYNYWRCVWLTNKVWHICKLTYKMTRIYIVDGFLSVYFASSLSLVSPRKVFFIPHILHTTAARSYHLCLCLNILMTFIILCQFTLTLWDLLLHISPTKCLASISMGQSFHLFRTKAILFTLSETDYF
jgi:hypothetical protein